MHPFGDFFLINIGHASLGVDIDALVNEIHVNIVGIGCNRQGADASLSYAAGRKVGRGTVGKFDQRGDVIFAGFVVRRFDRGSLYVDNRRFDQRLDNFNIMNHQIH